MTHAALDPLLAALWQNDAPAPAAQGPALCTALEARYGISLPEPFRTYVERWAPHEDDMHSTSGVILWAPDNMQSLADQAKTWSSGTVSCNPAIAEQADRYLVFADFLYWCGYGYAICCGKGADRGKIAMVGSPMDHILADDFCTFLGLLAEDSMVLHGASDAGRAAQPSWFARLKSVFGR